MDSSTATLRELVDVRDTGEERFDDVTKRQVELRVRAVRLSEPACHEFLETLREPPQPDC